MAAQHLRHLSHRLKAAAQGAGAPNIQESTRPEDRAVTPEIAKGLFEHPSAPGGQLAAQQSVEPLFGSASDSAPAPEQAPAHPLQFLATGMPAQLTALASPHLVYGFVQVHANVKAIEHVQSLGSVAGDDVQVGSPHIGADKAQ